MFKQNQHWPTTSTPPIEEQYIVIPGKTDGSEESWQNSVDGCRLVALLEELRACKDDEQQRSWALHEDEHTITSHLTDLLDLLVCWAW